MEISNEGNENNKNGYPYRLARLVKSKRKPYIVFYIWNENTEALERVRREKPAGQDLNVWSKQRIKAINELLIQGYRIVKTQNSKKVTDPSLYTISEAFDILHDIRVKNGIISKSTIGRQISFKKNFLEYLVANKLDQKPLKEIQKKDILPYIEGIVGNATTKNNYLTYIKTFFNEFEAREWIEKNPVAKIKRLKAVESSSVAFDPEHLPLLKKALLEHSTELYIFCMFVFYTFIRPIELRRLKVGDVDMKKRRIFIDGQNSKNKKSEYVLISKQFAEILEQHKFLDRPKDNQLFEMNNDLRYSKNWYSSEFRKICDKLGLPKSYELYGWKHTGVSEHYKISKDIVFIQRQCRHSSLDMTNKYLKGLGLFEDSSNLNNAPEI
jgi:integrase